MRSHIYDQFKRIHTDRKVSFWYGARSVCEMFYDDEYDQLEKEHDNFEWHVALSDPDGGMLHEGVRTYFGEVAVWEVAAWEVAAWEVAIWDPAIGASGLST